AAGRRGARMLPIIAWVSLCAHVGPRPTCNACRMTRLKAARVVDRALPPFDLQMFLNATGVGKQAADYVRDATIFTQGDAANEVFYIQTGGVKLTVLSKAGREAVVA